MKRFLFLFLSIFFSTLIILLIPFVRVIYPFLPFTNYLLGIDKPTSYHVLLGNDTEMRANGGFAGSYSKITLSTKRLEFLNPQVLEFSPEITFQDIYVPNGQLGGHVTPPTPIQQAFGHGTWELANADWEPDFPTAAQNIRWFLEKGKEINPDILAIVNLSTIKQVLNQIGSFPVPEYDATLTPDNLYLFLQGKTEVGFFPGSTQKRDTLTAVGQALIKKAKSLPLSKKIQIAHILYTDLINQNIMIHSSNQTFQSFMEQKKLAGVLSPEAVDTYSLIETNLGANKANQFVNRQTTHVISFVAPPSSLRVSYSNRGNLTPPIDSMDSTIIHHQVTVHFTNSSPAANPNPPIHYGGNYITYLRFYLPLEAKNIFLTRDPLSLPPLPDTILSTPSAVIASDSAAIQTNYGLTEIGFWQTTPAGGESTISLSYNLPLPDSRHCESGNLPAVGRRYRVFHDQVSLHQDSRCGYSLAILKQHGLLSSPQSINLFGQTYTTDLRHSFRYP